ncbi:MAG: outer membrane protein assembly factor BamA [Planctomycetes bacterium]|nr:outer membrane protein assembly factor BamA [Planctomycetota bacterium]
MSEVRSQMSEVRSQMSEFRSQKTEVRSQKTENRSQKSESVLAVTCAPGRHPVDYPLSSVLWLMSIVLLSFGSGCAFLGDQTKNNEIKKPAIDDGGRNVIKSIDFVNNRAFKDKSLEKRVDFEVGDYLDPILAEAYRRTIAEFYRKKGFAFVEVSLDSDKLEQGQVVYTIDEGPRVKIGSVKFSGNDSIKTSALKKAIKTKTKKWFFLSSYYVEEVPAEDVARLQNIYYERGFLDYNITAKKSFTNSRRKVRITFEIDEGPTYTVGKISLIGNKHFDDQRLLEGLKLEQGQIYYKRKADSHAKEILKLYHESGFVDAAVEQRHGFVPDVNVVNVEFDISEGRQFRIGRVDITGNEQTQDKVVRRVLDEYGFAPGQLYNSDLAPRHGNGKLEQYVRRMTLSEEVIIKFVSPGNRADNRKDMKVDIKEGQTGSLMFAGGVSSDSDVIGQMILEQRNFDITNRPKSFGEFITGQAFKGAGQSLRLALEPGIRVSQYSVTFSEPYFQDKPLSLNVRGSSWEREMERRGDRRLYDEGRTKGYVGFEKRYENRWRRSVGFRVESVDVDSIYLSAPQEIKDVKGHTFLTGVRFGIGRDLRDDRFNPSKGYTFNVDYEQVTGDETFGILQGSCVGYRTLYEDLAERKTVLTMKLLAATTLSYAPPFEKFYGGGTGVYGIRGFEYRGVSTRGLQTNVPTPQREDPIGSNWIFLANAEVGVPLVSDNFTALFFVDSGAIDTGNYRAAVGTGIQILIPQWSGPMPMRFEFAVPFMKDDEDEMRVFSFSMRGLF